MIDRMFRISVENPKTVLIAVFAAALLGARVWQGLAVDVFPDVSVPRVTIQTEAGGLTAEEVEQLVTIPIEAAVNGIPGVSVVRSSSGGGLSFVWVDFDWNADPARARFDVFERLSRVRESLPEEARAEISPVVSVTGEIMLVALTAQTNGVSALEMRELAEYDLRTRLLAIPGIGEVAVMGGRLPEYRVAADPRRVAEAGLSLADVIDAARDSRTFRSAGYLPDVGGEEVPLRQIARADTLEDLRAAPVPRATGGALRLGDVADVSVAGEPRRGSASCNGREAVVLSVQKTPGGNTPALTAAVDRALDGFSALAASRGIAVHADAYRQADFIAASVAGGRDVLRDAVIVVVLVLLLTLLEARTILVVLCTMPLSILLGVSLFPLFGLGVNVMTLGGLAVAAGDIVDAAIIFTEAVRRRLGENAALPPGARRPVPDVVVGAVRSVAPGVLFSSLVVALVFVPLLLLSGLEGRFFRPLALAYLCVFAASLACAWTVVPALARLLRLGSPARGGASGGGASPGVRAMRAVYRPFLACSLRFPVAVVLAAILLAGGAVVVASEFGSSFLPPFHEDSFNVMLSLPPGASLDETERVSEACVPALASIPGVKSVTRRTGRAERDQHAEPVSSSEFVVRVGLDGDTDAVRDAIRGKLGKIPGCSLVVGYPIAHRISAVLSGTEAELAVNVFGEDPGVLRAAAARMKAEMESMPEVADVRANREIAVRTLRIDYDMDALREAGITPREAGEQVSAAFNGFAVGEVRAGVRRRSVTVRLAGDGNAFRGEDVRALVLSGRSGRRVRLDDVARVVPEIAPNLLLREGGRRKALVSCNPAPGVSAGALVTALRARLAPIAAEAGCTVSFGGTGEARERAARRLAFLGAGLAALVFFVLVAALGSARAALLALVNVPLGLVGAVAAVALADPVLSVSSLVGFVTVTGFVIRNGILMLNAYRDRLADGAALADAVREGSLERLAPIVMTSLTTVIGLVPIVLAGNKPGGELLAPLAVVQFGGLVGAMLLNLLVLPAAVKLVGLGPAPARAPASLRAVAPVLAVALAFGGCRAYEPAPIDWEAEAPRGEGEEIRIASVEEAVRLALIGNREINAMRLAAARSADVARASGWWEDPEFDIDVLRILRSHPHPFLGGASVKFALPLSGVPGCEARAEESRSEADAAEVRAAERDLAVRVRRAAVGLAALETRARMLEDHDGDPRVARARGQVERLCAAGEVPVSVRAAMRRQRHVRRHARMETERGTGQARIAFLNLLGLRPETRLTFDPPPFAVPSEAAPRTAPLALAGHPRVVAARTRLGGAEADLEAEIRRQYPQLTVGPAYGNEEGLDRLGAGAGLTLPLWNRNRKGIAGAEKARDLARRTALDVWRELVAEEAAARANLADLLSHPPVPPHEREESDRLADAGELAPQDYLAVREEILDMQLSEAEWRREVELAAVELGRFEVGNRNGKEDME